jgi:hypothetical protein
VDIFTDTSLSNSMYEQAAAANNSKILHILQQNQYKCIELTKISAFMAVQAYEEHTRTGKLDSINMAVSIAAYSVKSTPEGSNLLPGCLNNYGLMLETRYKRTGDMADLEAAIQAAPRRPLTLPHKPTPFGRAG